MGITEDGSAVEVTGQDGRDPLGLETWKAGIRIF